MQRRMPTLWRLSAVIISVVLLVVVASYAVNYIFSSLFTQILVKAALILVLGVLSAWLIAEPLVRRPFRELVRGMDRLADRDLDFRLEDDQPNEFAPVAESFNDMADMLSASMTELKKNQDYLNSILESSADIIITVSPSGVIRSFNSGAESALGYSRAEVVGQPIEMVFENPEDRARAIERLRHTDSVVNYETTFKTKTGDWRDVLLTLSRLRSLAGDEIGTIGISKDVTEEKRLQVKLEQSRRLATIGEVFTGIQHSMKNMLNAMKGGSYMVKIGLQNDDQKMLIEGWEMVKQGIDRLTRMSKDMLKYVKDWVPRENDVDIADMLNGIFGVIKQTANDKGVAMDLKLCPDLPLVRCDSELIHSAVMDIVSNAVDACVWKEYNGGEQPAIVMSACHDNDNHNMIIEINDNGIGMSEDVKKRIFDPFFSTKSKAGTGLGLSLTARVINVHGGKIEVESEPEKGARFRILLPLEGTAKNKEHIDGQESTGM